MEMDSLAKAWNYKTNVLGNATLAQTDITGLYCPTRRSRIYSGVGDAALLVTTWTGGGTDYGGCVGRHNAYANNAAHSVEDAALNKNAGYIPTGSYAVANDCGRKRWGIFGRVNTSTSFREIRDGLSKTIMMGELQRAGMTRHRHHNSFVLPQRLGHRRRRHRITTGCISTPPLATGYSTPSQMNNGYFASPGSDHAGGANFGMGDGSVRFLGSSMDPNVFALLGSMADGAIMSSWDW